MRGHNILGRMGVTNFSSSINFRPAFQQPGLCNLFDSVWALKENYLLNDVGEDEILKNLINSLDLVSNQTNKGAETKFAIFPVSSANANIGRLLNIQNSKSFLEFVSQLGVMSYFPSEAFRSVQSCRYVEGNLFIFIRCKVLKFFFFFLKK